MRLSLLILFALVSMGSLAQDYFYQIPDAPQEYSAENVAARMVDGLGFRFYWATEGLKEEDLSAKASEEGRTLGETVDHIMGLTNVLAYALQSKVYENVELEGMSFGEKREWILKSLESSSKLLKQKGADLSEFKMIFPRESGNVEYDYWYLVNGPVADALWHCGQVVMLRRTAGNPFNSRVSVLQGKVRE